MLKTSHQRRFWLRIVLCLLVALGTLEGGVLCVGAEGHVAVERARQGSCTSPCNAAGASSACFLQSAPDDDCGPCVDVPLSHGSSAPSRSGAHQHLPPPSFEAVLASAEPVLVTPQAHLRASRLEEAPASPGLASFRSVVLLI